MTWRAEKLYYMSTGKRTGRKPLKEPHRPGGKRYIIMSKRYNLDDIKTNMAKELEEAEALGKAWAAVTYTTKKDGKPFAVLSKNILGASLRPAPYAIQPGENRIHVTTQTKNGRYISDEIDAYTLLKYLSDDDPRKAKPQNLQAKQTYLEQV